MLAKCGGGLKSDINFFFKLNTLVLYIYLLILIRLTFSTTFHLFWFYTCLSFSVRFYWLRYDYPSPHPFSAMEGCIVLGSFQLILYYFKQFLFIHTRTLQSNKKSKTKSTKKTNFLLSLLNPSSILIHIHSIAIHFPSTSIIIGMTLTFMLNCISYFCPQLFLTRSCCHHLLSTIVKKK